MRRRHFLHLVIYANQY
jgi:hypothetical protein